MFDMFRDDLDVLNFYKKGRGQLVNKLYMYDFFRYYEGWVPAEPIVYSFRGGFIAYIKVKGIDPEAFGPDTIADASAAVQRAFNGCRDEMLDPEFRGGQWEIINYFIRSRGSSPGLVKPTVENETLAYLWEKTNSYWEHKDTFVDEIIFTIHYSPRFVTNTEQIDFESETYHVDLIYPVFVRLARVFKGVVRSFLEDLNAFQTLKPKAGLGAAWMSEEEIHRFLYSFVNKTSQEPLPLDGSLPLLNQVCMTERRDPPGGEGYFIGDKRCDVITFKRFPTRTHGNLFVQIIENCKFPFVICQIFNSTDTQKVLKKNDANVKFAASLMKMQASADRYYHEGKTLEDTVNNRGNVLYLWKFACIVLGDTQHQLEDRSQKLKSYLKSVYSCEAVSEPHALRMVCELSTIPGNGFLNQRQIIASSENAGDVSFIFKRDNGQEHGDLILGDRIGGVYKYSVFDGNLVSWNFALLGLTGSGKSLLMNMLVNALICHPHQIYVIDKGNSYGTLFKALEESNPEAVAIMRVSSGDFKFNPLPFVSALRKRRDQVASGTYKMRMQDGEEIPCPVEIAKINFTAWIQVLLGNGREFTPEEKNKLDIALNGEAGSSGFFMDYEYQCQRYIDRMEEIERNLAVVEENLDGLSDSEVMANVSALGRAPKLPKPLSELRKYVANYASEFSDSLEIWTKGEYAKFFDSGEDSLAQAKAVYMELQGLERNPQLIRPFVAALIGISIWQRCIDPFCLHESKMIAIDEAWSFLTDPTFLRQIEEQMRTVRKYGGCVGLITQSPAEITRGDNIKLFDQVNRVLAYKGFSDPVVYEDIMDLNVHQINLHKSLRQDHLVHEVFYWDRRGAVRVFRVEVDPYRYWYVTSNAKDKDLRNSFVAHYGGIIEGIEHLVRACDGRTIGHENYRVKAVKKYAETNNFSLKGDL
jgi:hypothetical protein